MKEVAIEGRGRLRLKEPGFGIPHRFGMPDLDAYAGEVRGGVMTPSLVFFQLVAGSAFFNALPGMDGPYLVLALPAIHVHVDSRAIAYVKAFYLPFITFLAVGGTAGLRKKSGDNCLERSDQDAPTLHREGGEP